MSKERSRTYPTKAEICRVVEAARGAGVDVAGLEIRPDGTIFVFEARNGPSAQTDFDRCKHLM